MTSISGINPNDDDKKITLKAVKSEIKNEPIVFTRGNELIDTSNDFKVKGLSVESSATDIKAVYHKKFLELQRVINEKEQNNQPVSNEEYTLLEKYDILAARDFNPSAKILTKAEEDVYVAEEKHKIETENPYWNEYNSAKSKLENYEKSSPDRTSAKYKELLNTWRRYETLVSSYEYSRGSSKEDYEKAHPVNGNITPDSREVSLNKNVSAQAGNFSFNGSADTNLSLNDIDRGKGNLSSTVSGGVGFNKNNLSVISNADVCLHGLTESSISPSYNLNANASYNLKGFNFSGNISKNISNESEMTTKEFSVNKGISNFNFSVSHSFNDMQFGEMSSQTATTSANVNYNQGKLSLNSGYSHMETKSESFNELANTVSIGGSFNHKNMNYNLNTDLMFSNGETTPTYSASVAYSKDRLTAGLNASHTGGEFSRSTLGANIAYSKENLTVKADVQYAKGQKPSGMVSVRANF